MKKVVIVISIVVLVLLAAIFFSIQKIRDCDRIGGTWVGGLTQMAYCVPPKKINAAGQLTQ